MSVWAEYVQIASRVGVLNSNEFLDYILKISLTAKKQKVSLGLLSALETDHLVGNQVRVDGRALCSRRLEVLISSAVSVMRLRCPFFKKGLNCLCYRRRRLSTFTIGSVLVLTYFAIGFGFVDPHWSEGKPRSQIVSSYCFFHMDYFVQVQHREQKQNFPYI